MLRTLLILGRVSNLPTVWSNCLAGWVLASYAIQEGGLGALNTHDLFWLMAGASLLYVGGMAMNDACDVAFDRKHNPERPIPAGAISRPAVWGLSAVCLGVGAAIIIGERPGAWPWVAGLVGAIVLYDLVHKRWQGAVLLMGACRFLLYAVAGFAAFSGDDSLAMPARLWVAASGMFLYIVGVTFVARGEATGEKVRRWSWALLVGPAAAWLISSPGPAGIVFLLAFFGWLARSVLLLRGDDPARVGRFVSSLLAGIVLADAVMICGASPEAALICASLLPLNVVLQRFVPAT